MAITTRQPRRSKKQWQSIIDNQAQSGMSITDYCDHLNIPISSFQRWQKNLTQSQGSPLAPFIELPRVSQPNVNTESARLVELDLGNGMRLKIEGI